MLKQPFTDETVIVKIIDEPNFVQTFESNKKKLISRLGKIRNENLKFKKYEYYNEEIELREIENTLDIYLSQSILFEDKMEILRQIRKACRINEFFDRSSLTIEYWGQSERIRNTGVDTKA